MLERERERGGWEGERGGRDRQTKRDAERYRQTEAETERERERQRQRQRKRGREQLYCHLWIELISHKSFATCSHTIQNSWMQCNITFVHS